MKNRLFSFFLILTLLLTMLPVSAIAAGTPPGLRYQRLIYGNSDMLHEDGNWQNRPISVEFEKKFPLALYYYDGSTYTPVTEGADVSGPLELEPTGTEDHHYYVVGKNWGSGELVYEPEDDLQYTLSVNVDIPSEAAPYKAPERSQANYLKKFQLNRNLPDEDRTLYIMAEGGFGDPNSVEAFFPGSNQVNFRWSVKTLPNGESYIKIDKISKTGDLVLDIQYADGHDNRVRLKVEDVTPGLYVRNIERNGYEGIEDSSKSMSPDPISMTKGFNRTIALYWFDGKTYTPVTDAEGTGSAGLQRLLSADHHYILSAEEWGSGAIEAEIGMTDQRLPLNVALGRTSFFSRQEYSTDALGGGCFFNRGADEETVVWFMMNEGFSLADARAITLTSPTAGVNASRVAETSVVFRPGTESDPRYDLKIEVLEGPNDIGLNSYDLRVNGKSGDHSFGLGFGVYEHRRNNGMVQYPLKEGDSHDGQSKVFHVSGVPIVAGIFVREADGDIITMVADAENNWTFKDTDTPEATENWGTFRAIEFGAAVRATTANGSVYNLDETLTKNMQLHSVSLAAVEGEEEDGKPKAFSLSGSQWVTESTSLENGFHLYWSSVYSGKALLKCEVSMDEGEEPFTISAMLSNILVDEVGETRPSEDTMADLNEFFEEFAEDYADYDPELFRLTLVLNPKATYEGTIRVPENFPAELWLLGEAGKDRTTLQGSLEAGSMVGKAEGIDFVGEGKDDPEQKPAIFGESVQNIYDCSFIGYPIALEGKASLMTPSRGNVFLNNGVAVLVDMEGSNGANRNFWKNNRFLNNDVAVQVLSLCDFIHPFNLRIYDSDFIDNGMDFDFQSPQGSYYLYRNYYAHTASGTPEFGTRFWKDFWNNDRDNDDEPDCDRNYRTPITSNVDGILQVTNPRRLHSILHEDDTLWIDLDRIVEVLNQEANDLIIDSEALTDQDEDVEIKVRNEDEKREGSWHFKGSKGNRAQLASATPLSSTGFNASLDITRSSHQISVEVQESSVLATEIPELSIPCDFTQAYVTLNGTPVVSTLAGGEICFPVAQGGTYVIHSGSAPAVTESSIESARVSGSTFSAEVLCSSAQESAVVAAYDANDMLLDCWVFTLEAGPNTVTQSLAGISAKTAQIFVLGQGAIPACENKSVPAG